MPFYTNKTQGALVLNTHGKKKELVQVLLNPGETKEFDLVESDVNDFRLEEGHLVEGKKAAKEAEVETGDDKDKKAAGKTTGKKAS